MPASTIPLQRIESSQLHAIGYDPASQTLAIEFNSNHDKLTYEYPNCKPELYEALLAAESKGSFFYKQVKTNWPTADDFVRRFKDDEPKEA